MNNVLEPNILLLGCGYTLQRLAARLDPATFVSTVTSLEKRDALRTLGYNAEIADLENSDDMTVILARYPEINVIVDSVPPIRDSAQSSDSVCAAISSAAHHKVKRVIYLSTSGVFGGVGGVWVDENTVPNPLNARARARLLCEQIYRKLESTRIEICALRIPAIYSGERGLKQSLEARQFRLLDGGTAWSNRIHVDDLVEVIYQLLEQPLSSRLPPVVPICDDEPARYIDIVKFYCERFNLAMPVSVSREDVSERELAHFMTDQRISNKLMKSLGVRLLYPSYKSLGAR